MKKDYEKIGLKCGLEIHQQLDSRKLFCRCPSVLRRDEPDFKVKRKLHAVAGETGEVDVAALYQTSLGEEFIYEGYDSTCLVELDEEPPMEIDEEALKIALHISLLLNCKIIPLGQIMRKTVVDGSNTSGFQRTVLIAEDGWIGTSQGKVGINYVYLEEDSARKVKSSCASLTSLGKEEDSARKVRSNENNVYRLDRLGIPLVEIVTAPDIKNPEHAKETALNIGKILRSCDVRRGIGTIRQDINVSIRGHPRAEIKGFQDPKVFVRVVEKEVERQLNNLEKIKKGKSFLPEVRGANPDASTRYLRPLPGSARMYPETDLSLLKISKKIIDGAKKSLPCLTENIQEDLRKKGLNEELIKLLLKEKKIDEFKELLEIVDNPNLIGKLVLIFPREIASRKKIPSEKVRDVLSKDVLSYVLESLKDNKFPEGEIKFVLENIVEGKSPEDAVDLEKKDLNQIEEKIMSIIKEKPGLSSNAYMGLAMKEFKGSVSGREIKSIIERHIK